MTGMIGGSSAFEDAPSMKVPPKRKGNGLGKISALLESAPSMKVPPKRKGNLVCRGRLGRRWRPQ